MCDEFKSWLKIIFLVLNVTYSQGTSFFLRNYFTRNHFIYIYTWLVILFVENVITALIGAANLPRWKEEFSVFAQGGPDPLWMPCSISR